MSSFSDWEDVIPNLDQNNIEVGLDYWFKLKNQRVEFMPEVYYGLNDQHLYFIPTGQELEFNHSYVGLQVNTQLYILDFQGDCDCPTFSKQGPSIKKGFFVNIAPGAVYNNYSRTTEVASIPSPNVSKINFRLGIGAGYDIGINDLFTITPFANFTYSPGNDADIFNPANQAISSAWSAIQFGIRFGFRPDYVRRYGR